MAPSLPSTAERERMLAKIEPLSIHLVHTGALRALAKASRAFPLAAGVALYEAGSERNTELHFVASGSLRVLRAAPSGAGGPRARYWRRFVAQPTRFAARPAGRRRARPFPADPLPIAACRLANGTETREESLEEVATVGRGAVVGGSAFFSRKPHHVTVVALSKSIIVSISRSDLLTHAPPEALVALADHARRTVHADLEVVRRSPPPQPGISKTLASAAAAVGGHGARGGPGGRADAGGAPAARPAAGTSAQSDIARLLAQSAARIAIRVPGGAAPGSGASSFSVRRRGRQRGGGQHSSPARTPLVPSAADHGPTKAALDRARRAPRWAMPATDAQPSTPSPEAPRPVLHYDPPAKAATVSSVALGLNVAAAAASRAHAFTQAMQWQRSVDLDAKAGSSPPARNAAPAAASPPPVERGSPGFAQWSPEAPAASDGSHTAPPPDLSSRMTVSGRTLGARTTRAPTRVTLSAKDLPPVPAGQPVGAALTSSVAKGGTRRGTQPTLLLHLRPQPGRCAPREWWSSLPLDSFPAGDGGGDAVEAAVHTRRQLAGAALRNTTRTVTALWRSICGGVALRACSCEMGWG